MSHFPVLVIVDEEITREQAEDYVEPLLAPYDENEEWFADGSRWDWWVIGGRWTGCLTGDDYEPRDDERNFSTCRVCAGTGERPNGRGEFGEEWYVQTNGCNGCHGTGRSLNFSFADYEGDVVQLKDYRPKSESWIDTKTGEGKKWTFSPQAIVTPDGKWHERGRVGWFGVSIPDEDGQEEKDERAWEGTVNALFDQYPDTMIVLVDCHV